MLNIFSPAQETSGHSMVSTRSNQGHSTRLVHHLNPAATAKEFHPPPPFSADTKALDEFKAENYFKNVNVLTTGRSWGLLSGPGVGTFLMATAWYGSSLRAHTSSKMYVEQYFA